MKNKTLFATALAFAPLAANADIVINEIMQSNIDCIMDNLNDFPDSWVEFYNPDDGWHNLAHYSMGLTDDPTQAWVFSECYIAPHQYAVVYCDKVGEGLHTPFRLESGKGCSLFLYHYDTLIDRLPDGMKKQPAPNVAYGRVTDGSSDWGYQLTPTPGAANTGDVCTNKQVLGNPVFSVAGCVMRSGETLSLELAVPDGSPSGTEVRYTLDGTEPSLSSTRYTSPLTVKGGTVVRAALFCPGWLTPRSTTHSYLTLDRDVTLPVISVVTDPSYLYDNRIGIYVDGNYDDKKNYEHNWRRPMNFEYFDGDITDAAINQLGEARITGAASRGCTLKSLGIYANKRFGEKRFTHEFFPDQRPGITDFKSLMLRNAGNDFDYLYMRDAVIQRLMSAYTDIDWQAWSPAIFFLNGQYKGMLNIRERSNEDNIYTNYNGLEDIDMVENWWELKEGRWSEWENFQAFYGEHGHTWADYDRWMDVSEFADVMIMNLFFCNLDFPGNNIVWWKPQTDGARWRVIVKDTDFGLGLYGRSPEYNTLEWIYNPEYDSGNAWANQWEHTRLFRRLMEDETFNRVFIDRFAIYMGDFMNFPRTWRIWEPMYQKISYEYPYHRELFNRWWPNYAEELANAQHWLQQRVPVMYRHLHNFFNLGDQRVLTVNKCTDASELDGAGITFNGVRLSEGTFDGMFFVGRPITIHSDKASGWRVNRVKAVGETTEEVIGSTCSIVITADCASVDVEMLTDPDGLHAVEADGAAPVYYDVMGRPHTTPVGGVNIVPTPTGAYKFIKH